MIQDSDIKILLQKFVQNQCNPLEIEQVIAYCKANNLTEDFPTVEEIQLLLQDLPEMEKMTADKIFANILSKSNEPKVISIPNRKRSWMKYTAVAASLLLLLGIGISYQLGNFDKSENQILTGNEITLQLENGEIQVVSDKTKIDVKDSNGNIIGTQTGNKIVYNKTASAGKLVYNTLKIPYGKRFELQLSDGTSIHLNAGTTLKYPIQFITGKNRQVYLDGEAYFDVSKDKLHPFVVNADELNVRVLGTHFNVSNYPEDEMTDVVLVEGSVGLYEANKEFDAEKSTILKPGFKGSFDRKNNSISTKSVDTEIYTAWVDGELYLRNMSFETICKKLERRYDVTITNKNSRLANEKFNASFKEEPIEKVLSYFNDVYGIQYTITNKQVTIK